ncbi:MAG: PEGA domain-containing protein [Bradymonadia bacterium]
MRSALALAAALTVIGVCALASAQDKPAVVKDAERKLDAQKEMQKQAQRTLDQEQKAKAKRKAAPKTVTLRLTTRPKVRASVYWGKEKLGVTPLTLKRQRDSGPIDVKVVAGGYIPVNTRIYTFRDDDVSVTLTPASKANTLYGYKKPLPPDAGVPEEAPPGGGDEDAPPPPAPAPVQP